MHVFALSADGFHEQHPKKNLGSGPTRCFVRVHGTGLLIETHHIDMGSRPAAVEIDLKLDVEALRELGEKAKEILSRPPDRRASGMNAFRIEHRSLLDVLKRIPPGDPDNPELRGIQEFLRLVA